VPPPQAGRHSGGNVWKKQARLTERYSRDGCSFLRGFEYTSDQENHVNVIGSPDYLGGKWDGVFCGLAIF
jgi:hypothetical protein